MTNFEIVELVDNNEIDAEKGALALVLSKGPHTLHVCWLSGHKYQQDGNYDSSRFIYRCDLREWISEIKEVRKLVGYNGFTLPGAVKDALDQKNKIIANQISKIMELEKQISNQAESIKKSLSFAEQINKTRAIVGLYVQNLNLHERDLKTEVENLNKKCVELSEENDELSEENDELNEENGKLSEEVEENLGIIHDLNELNDKLEAEIAEARRIVGSEGTLAEAIGEYAKKREAYGFKSGAFGRLYGLQKPLHFKPTISFGKGLEIIDETSVFKKQTKVVLIDGWNVGETGTLLNAYGNRYVVKMDNGGEIDYPSSVFVKVGDTVKLIKHDGPLNAPIGSLATVTGWDDRFLNVKWNGKVGQNDGGYLFKSFQKVKDLPKQVRVLKDQIIFPRGVYKVEADHVDHWKINGSYVLKSQCQEV